MAKLMPILTVSCAAAVLAVSAAIAAAVSAIANCPDRMSFLPPGDAGFRFDFYHTAGGSTTPGRRQRAITTGRARSARDAAPPAYSWRLAGRGRGRAGRLWPRDSASPGTPATAAARPG